MSDKEKSSSIPNMVGFVKDRISLSSERNAKDRNQSSVKVMDKQSIDYVVRSGTAGGIAGSAAKTLIAPLDRIKILFQTSNPDFLKYRGTFTGFFKAGRLIWSSDGILGLYQGHSVTLLRIFPYAAIKFVAYEQIRALLIPNDLKETAIRRFMAGSLSGLASVFVTYPLDLIRVRMAFETKNLYHYSGAAQAHEAHRGRLFLTIKDIFKEKPPHKPSDPHWLRYLRDKLPGSMVAISNFYRGFAPTILGMVPYAGVSFYAYDAFHDLFRSQHLYKYAVQTHSDDDSLPKRIVNPSKQKQQLSSRDSRLPLKAYAQLIAGGLAGMTSQTAAYPFEVIRRRMQVGGVINQGQFLSFRATARLIFKEAGFRGFFVGLTIGYIKVIPMGACSYYVYERSKRMLGI